jgi:CheY-like chemotaxis protein
MDYKQLFKDIVTLNLKPFRVRYYKVIARVKRFLFVHKKYNPSDFKNIPIIFVTSNKGIIDKVKARFVGASGYLTKPFTRAELLKMIFMHLA